MAVGPVPSPVSRPFNPVLPDRRRPEVQALRADGRRLLTIHEVAAHLNTSVAIVRKLLNAGTLRRVKLSPRVTRIPEQAVLAILNR
jgi:excisionase family DNA binding protein